MIHELFDELSMVLRALRVYYGEYLELGKRQRQAVVHNQLNEIQEINLEVDRFVFRVEELEHERLALMDRLQQKTGLQMTRLTELREHYSGAELERMLAEAQGLRDVLSEVKNRNEVNQKLIKNSREYVRQTLAIVTGYVSPKPQKSFATYGRSGRVQVPRSQDLRLFTGSL